MHSDEYLAEVESRLSKMFLVSRNGYKASAIERHRLEGFIQAGVFVGLTSNTELGKLMEDIHLSIFGKTIRERRMEQPSVWKDEAIDYSPYEQPTYERIHDV